MLHRPPMTHWAVRTLPQVLLTPSGPPQRFFPACSRTCQACSLLPPQVGVLGGIPPSTLAAIPPQAAAYRQVRRLPPPQVVAFC
ncbi:MAG: hypothetical protein ACK53Y_16775 [bacterium]